jgi:excisionase family DNA binding protein
MAKKTRKPPQPQTERLTLTVDEVAVKLGISRGQAYAAVRADKIPSLKLGVGKQRNRYVIPRAPFERMLACEQFPKVV